MQMSSSTPLASSVPPHGGNLSAEAKRLGCSPRRLLDASASLVPLAPRLPQGWWRVGLRDYPDRSHAQLRHLIAACHGLPPELVLPGNGAAELFTWAARDAAMAGAANLALSPGFADYSRALRSWGLELTGVPLPLIDISAGHQSFPRVPAGDVLWICNPHNPTGQLWSGESLESLLARFRLVICDEAFLSLVPDGEAQSLIPLVASHPNLVVIRSLTKLYGAAGLRLGYAIAQPNRLQRWADWRDPWPVNGLASAAAAHWLGTPQRYQRWCRKAQAWVAKEGAWMQQQLHQLPGITPMPSAVNFLLIRADQSLVPLREALEQRHHILLRDCRSFEGLGACWLRIGLQSRANNRRIIRALRVELKRQPLA